MNIRLPHPLEGDAVDSEVLSAVLQVLPDRLPRPQAADIILLLQRHTPQPFVPGVLQEDDPADPGAHDDGVKRGPGLRPRFWETVVHRCGLRGPIAHNSTLCPLRAQSKGLSTKHPLHVMESEARARSLLTLS
jgi:hypothetical protein